MSNKEQLIKARDLIKEKRYEEARDLLENINHPKAQEWLGQLNIRLAQKASTQSSRTGNSTQSRRPQPQPMESSSGSGSGFLLPVILIIVLLVIAGAGAAIIIPQLTGNQSETVVADDSDDSNEAQSVDDDDTTTNNDDTSDESANNTQSDTSSDESQDEGDNNADTGSSSGEIVGSGVRMPLPDGGNMVFYAELPDGYSCRCDISINRIHGEDRFTYFSVQFAQRAFDVDYYIDKPIDEMITNEVREGDTLNGQETVQANGRDVVIVRITDEDGDTEISYNVKDENGRIIRVVIPAFIDEPETLLDAALFVAGNVTGDVGEDAEPFFDAMQESRVSYDEATNTWSFRDLEPSRINTVVLPDGWEMDNATSAIKDGDRNTSATSISWLRVSVSDGETLSQTLDEVYPNNGGTTIESEEMVTSNGRDILVRQELDTQVNQQTLNVYVADSDGDLMALIVQSFVENQDILKDDVVAMAGTLESEEFGWEEQLRLAGLLEG